MRYLLLFSCFFAVPLCVWGQLKISASAKESRCSANGVVTVDASGGVKPYIFEFVSSPQGFVRPAQNSDTFRLMPPGNYTIQVTDADSRTARANVTVPGDYREPTMDSCIVRGSKISVYATGGRYKYRYAYSYSAAFTSPVFQDSSVFDCLPNGDYWIRIYDSCDNFYTQQRGVSVQSLYFSSECKAQTGAGTTDIALLNQSGGEPPYLYTCVSNFGDTLRNATGNFTGLKGCNFRVFLTDKCDRRYERFFDCPPANLILSVRCASIDQGTGTVVASGGTPPYRFEELNSVTPVNKTGVFTGLRKRIGGYQFRVTDTCGRSTIAYVDSITNYSITWAKCPFNGVVNANFYQRKDEIGTCGKNCSLFYPYVFTCLTCSPATTLADSGQAGGAYPYHYFSLKDVAAKNHTFRVTNGCGDTLITNLLVDSVQVTLNAGVSCEGGVINAYTNLANTVYTFKDSSGVVLATNTTGLFNAPYQGIIKVAASVSGCGSTQIDVSAFERPTINVTYLSCDSIATSVCPNIPGWTFMAVDAKGTVVAKNNTGNFTGLPFGTAFQILGTHPKFRDTVRVAAGTSVIPDLYPSNVTCSSLCAYFPYYVNDQHGAPVTYTLTDSATKQLIRTQVNSACFGALQPGTTYLLTASTPYCGTRQIYIRTAAADKPAFCLQPSGRNNKKGKPEFAWTLIASAASNDFKLSGGPDTVQLEARNGYFYELAPGKYILNADCSSDSITLPAVTSKIYAKPGPSCPNVSSILAYGGRTAADWRSLGDSLRVNICNPAADDYYLYDKNGTYLGGNTNGNLVYLAPGERYKVGLGKYGFVFDTIVLTTTFYERPDLVTKYGAICATGRTTGRITANLTGGGPPFTFQILQPAGIRPDIRSDVGKAVFEDLPAGSYTLRAYDGCGISADYTGSIGFLKFTPKYQRLCDGTIRLEVPEIDSAQYEWKDAGGVVVGAKNTLFIKDNGAVTYSVTVKTTDSCVFTNSVSIPKLLNNSVKANAGEDIVTNTPITALNAEPVTGSQKGRWTKVSPSSGSVNFTSQTDPKTPIKVSQFPGQYTFVWEVSDDSLGCAAYDTVSVVFCETIDSIVASVETTVSSCLKPTGTAKAAVKNAATLLTYKWSNGKETAQVDSLDGGVYYVTINDQLVCTPPLVKKFEIIQPKVNSSLVKADALCFASATGKAAVSPSGGSGPYTIRWADGDQKFARANLSLGLYTYSVTDVNGCFVKDTFQISQPKQILTFRADTICREDSLVIGGAYIHKETAIYKDTLTSATGCDSIVHSNLFVRQTPVFRQKVVSCYGDTVRVGLKKYFTKGAYTDTLKTANGCDSVVYTNLDILKIDAQIKSTPAVCTANGILEIKPSSTLNDSAFIYRWNTGGADPVNAHLAFGKYAVTVTQGLCSAVFTGAVDTTPNALTVLAEIKNPNCPAEPSGKINLTVQGYKTFFKTLWNTGDSAAQLKNLPAGKYQVSIVDGNGCQTGNFFDLKAPDGMAVVLKNKDISCYKYKDGVIELKQTTGGTPPYLFSLDRPNNFKPDTFFKDLPAGAHALLVKDAHQCIFEQSIFLAEPDELKVFINGEDTALLGESVRLRALVTNFKPPVLFEWRSAPEVAIGCKNCPETTAKSFNDFYIRIKVTDPASCTASDSVKISVNKTRKLFAPNVFSPNNDGVNDRFNLYTDAGLKNIKQLKIFNRWGSLIYEAENILPNSDQTGWDGTYQGTLLTPDVFVYWAEIEWLDGKTEIVKGDFTLVR